MIPEEESNQPAEPTAEVGQSSNLPRRRGRGHRGGRGRGRGRGRRPQEHQDSPAETASQTAETPEQDEQSAEQAPLTHSPPEETAEAIQHVQPEPEAASPPTRSHESRRAEPAAVKDAIDEVNRIITTLQETLGDMEEVLETIELAERQKNADEREIETLRRALGRMHGPRDRSQRPH